MEIALRGPSIQLVGFLLKQLFSMLVRQLDETARTFTWRDSYPLLGQIFEIVNSPVNAVK